MVHAALQEGYGLFTHYATVDFPLTSTKRMCAKDPPSNAAAALFDARQHMHREARTFCAASARTPQQVSQVVTRCGWRRRACRADKRQIGREIERC